MNYILIDIGGTKTAVLIAADDGGEPRFLESTVFKTADYTPDALLDECCRAAQGYIQKHGTAAAVGVCCGGPLDEKKGIVMRPPNLPDWDNIEVKAVIEKRLKLPCEVRNDANACAVAEYLYGAGKGSKNMIFMTFGTGLGAGLILDGKLYSGSGAAGEVGHILMKNRGPVGYGRAGTAEGFCSGGGIGRLAVIVCREAEKKGLITRLTLEEKEGEVPAKRIAELAREGDVLAKKTFAESAKVFGRLCSVLIDLFAPDVIAAGGVFMRSRDLFEPYLSEAIAENALKDSAEKCLITGSKLGDEIGNYACFAIAKGEL